jgi:elongator complex protein 3
LPDLHDAAIVREVHVYGQSVEVGKTHAGAVQHSGLGAKLMERAEEIAHQHGYERLGVIAALGTRGYYRKLGYDLGENYMLKDLG